MTRWREYLPLLHLCLEAAYTVCMAIAVIYLIVAFATGDLTVTARLR